MFVADPVARTGLLARNLPGEHSEINAFKVGPSTHLSLGIVAPRVDACIFPAGHGVRPAGMLHGFILRADFVAFSVKTDVPKAVYCRHVCDMCSRSVGVARSLAH